MDTTSMVCTFISPHSQDETYRLFGISSFLMQRKNLTCIRFDTCYLGHYYEIYYVFLFVSPTEGTAPTIAAHTLPPFLPIQEWEEQYLPRDVQVCSPVPLSCRRSRSVSRSI